jgi:hypothetical protein
MGQRLELLASKYAGDMVAEPILRDSAEEIVSYRKYAHYYGYAFLVMTTDGGTPPSGNA